MDGGGTLKRETFIGTFNYLLFLVSCFFTSTSSSSIFFFRFLFFFSSSSSRRRCCSCCWFYCESFWKCEKNREADHLRLGHSKEGHHDPPPSSRLFQRSCCTFLAVWVHVIRRFQLNVEKKWQTSTIVAPEVLVHWKIIRVIFHWSTYGYHFRRSQSGGNMSSNLWITWIARFFLPLQPAYLNCWGSSKHQKTEAILSFCQ